MNFEIIEDIIKNRRSCKPALMNGKKIDDAIINKLLELANWAPTHAHTEPWRFIVFNGDALHRFSKDHAELYKANTPTEKFEAAKYEKLLHNADKASHVIVVYMKRDTNPKITFIEEVCAVAAAVQNILLGAACLNIAALWSTGGLTFHPAMKTYFGLNNEDQIISLLYLGYTDAVLKEGERIIPLNEKTDWKN